MPISADVVERGLLMASLLSEERCSVGGCRAGPAVAPNRWLVSGSREQVRLVSDFQRQNVQ